MSQSLSEILIEICDRPVDAGTRERAALHLRDWLGCALVGSTAPAGKAMAAYALGGLPGGICFAAGAPDQDAAGAAFVNGGLGNIFEMDDVHRLSILHAGDTVVPAALAVAQAEGIDGPALLDAMVRGYEMAIRIGNAASASGYSAWYNSGTCGVFGAAMAASAAIGLDRGQTADALGQAGMMASGLWQCRLEPTFSKQLATANAARAGVVAAQLARVGFPGAKEILEGDLGFFKTLYPSANPADAIAAPDASWIINDVSFKPWSACRHTHPVIEAALALRADCPPDRIERVTITTYDAAIVFCDNPAPASDHEARFSLQHCVAVALVRGEPGLSDFGADARADSNVARLSQRTDLVSDDTMTGKFPACMGASINVQLVDGSVRCEDVTTAKGDPENPMGSDELAAKFMLLANTAGVSKSQAAALDRAIGDLTGGKTLQPLDQALADISTALCPTASR